MACVREHARRSREESVSFTEITLSKEGVVVNSKPPAFHRPEKL